MQIFNKKDSESVHKTCFMCFEPNIREGMGYDTTLHPQKLLDSELPWAPKTMQNQGFDHLKARLFTIKPSKHVGFAGPWCKLQDFFSIPTSFVDMRPRKRAAAVK